MIYPVTMGIWDRLGTVINSYLHDFENETTKTFKRNTQSSFNKNFTGGDPDLDAAYEELDDFLGGKGENGDNKKENAGQAKGNFDRRKRTVPEELKSDFAELGLTPEAGAEECKEAYKKLLKIHHPDRHAKHEGNLKKATDKTKRVNVAYERLMRWFKTNTHPAP